MVHSVYINVLEVGRVFLLKIGALLARGQYQLGGQIGWKDKTASVLRDAFPIWSS
jgi:hypothetical protein